LKQLRSSKKCFNSTCAATAFLLLHLYALVRLDRQPYAVFELSFLCISLGFLIIVSLVEFNIALKRVSIAVLILIALFEPVNILLSNKELAYYTSPYFRNVNLVATYISVFYFILVLELNGKLKVWLKIALAAVVFGALIWLQSRAAFIAFAVSILIYFRFSVNKALAASLALVIVSVMLFYAINISGNAKKQGSIIGRTLIYKVCLADHSNLFTGAGTGKFVNYFPEAQAKFVKENKKAKFILSADTPIAAFNEFLHLASELGFVGLTLFVITIIPLFKVRNVSKHPQMLIPICLLINSLFSYTFHNIILVLLFNYYLCQYLLPTKVIELRGKKYLLNFGWVFLAVGVISGLFIQYLNFCKKNLKENNNVTYSQLVKLEKTIFPFFKNDARFSHLLASKYITDCDSLGKAIGILEDSKQHSNNYDNQLLLSELYMEKNVIDSAILNLIIAKEYLPNKFLPHFYLQNIYLQSKDTLKAKEEAKNISSLLIKKPSKEIELIKKSAQATLAY
jgi:hypothetical protein